MANTLQVPKEQFGSLLHHESNRGHADVSEIIGNKDDVTVTQCNSIINVKTDNATETTKAKLKRKTVWFSKKLLVFTFSHVGMVCIVIGYSILGAIIFRALERPQEIQNRIFINEVREATRERLWTMTKHLIAYVHDNYTKAVEPILIDFQTKIYDATKNLGWDGKNSEAEENMDWSFSGALLYSVTVITTIGYGHIAPKTDMGRVITIIYAFFGIPLTLICLGNIGMLMSKSFKLFYNKADKSIRFYKDRQLYQLNDVSQARISKVTGSIDGQIGQGKCKPDHNVPKHVPIPVCFLVVITYNLFGSILFDLWESSWDYLTSLYFCFITLSTIGFGDVVPGHTIDSWNSQSKQVTCTLWLLFGLALLAMCFDLMQEQVRNIAKSVARCVGLRDPKVAQGV